MDKNLYEFLINNTYFTHTIGRINNKTTLSKFESILKLKGLYSKEQLRKRNYQVEGIVSGNIRITPDRYVSVFDPNLPQLSKKLLSNKFNKVSPIDTDNIMFVIDSSIEQLPNVKRNDFDYSEIVARDYLPADYFTAVVAPNNKDVLKFIQSTMEKYDFELPVYSYDGSLAKLTNKRK